MLNTSNASHTLSIKTRLLTLAVINIAAIVALLAGKILFDMERNREFAQNSLRVQEVESLAASIDLLQLERGYSVGFLSSKGSGASAQSLPQTRQKLDLAIAEIKKTFEKTGSTPQMLNSLADLARIRSEVQSLLASEGQVVRFYSNAIASFIANASDITPTVNDTFTRNSLQSYIYLALSKESLGQLRANLTGVFNRQKLDDASCFALGDTLGKYDLALGELNIIYPKALQNYKNDPSVLKTIGTIDYVRSIGTAGEIVQDPSEWFKLSTTAINLLGDQKSVIFAELKTHIQSTQNSIEREVIIISVASFVGLVVFMIVLLYILLHSISKPLEAFKKSMLGIATQNNLTIKVDERSPQELSEIATSFNSLIANLRELIDTSKIGSSENASISHELSTTAISVGENV
ncbi:MAG: methyl-accepting chemotaxis protein, partial [Sulfuricurvum sp.]